MHIIDENSLKSMKVDTHNSFNLRFSSISEINLFTIDFVDYRISLIEPAGSKNTYTPQKHLFNTT